MSLSPNEKYPGATEADPNYKDSKFKDNNPSTTNNGSPLKALDRNEQLALQEAMMNAAGFDYNGVVDTPQNSQMFNAYKAALSNGANLLSNHNFIIASPDDSQPAPSATPTSYPPGYEIFSGVFANETTGILNLTYIDGRVSFSGGDFYMAVPNTGALENITEFVASVADFDGKPRTRGVSYALVGDEYRVTVGVDALEDESANETLLGSVKFEQGSVATGHEVQSAKGQTYTFDNVAQMIAGRPPINSIIDTKGYYALGDGGGGQYLSVMGNVGDGYVNHNSGQVTLVLQGDKITSRQVGALWDSAFNNDHAIENYYRLNAMLSAENFTHFEYSNPEGTEISVTGSIMLYRSNTHITHAAGSRVTGKYEVPGQPGDIFQGGQLFGFVPTGWDTDPDVRIINVKIDGNGEIETYDDPAYSFRYNNNCYGGGKAENFDIDEIKITGSDHGGIVFDFLSANINIGPTVKVLNTYDTPIIIKNEVSPEVPGATVNKKSVCNVSAYCSNSQWGGDDDPMFVRFGGGGVFNFNGALINRHPTIIPQSVTAFGCRLVNIADSFISRCSFGGRSYNTQVFKITDSTLDNCTHQIGYFCENNLSVKSLIMDNIKIQGVITSIVHNDAGVAPEKITITDSEMTEVSSAWQWSSVIAAPKAIILKDNDTNSLGAFNYQSGWMNQISYSKVVAGDTIDYLGDNGDFPYSMATVTVLQGSSPVKQSSIAFYLPTIESLDETLYQFNQPLTRAGDGESTTVKAVKSGTTVSFSIDNVTLGFSIPSVTLHN